MQTMQKCKKAERNPWAWIPSLYFAEGLPYVIVMTVSVIMYKRLDISNSDIALYTSWLYLPWVIKPLWSPVVDVLKTKRWWIVVMQLTLGVGLAGVAFTIPAPDFFRWSLAFLWLLAFSSATHDIAADGFYMMGLNQHDQSYFIGIRNTFYRLAMLSGQGLLVILAGYLEKCSLFGETENISIAWSITFFILAGLFIFFWLVHFVILPHPKEDQSTGERILFSKVIAEIGETFASFFRKENIGIAIAFILLYRLGESQLVKLAAPFLLDTAENGGLGLTTAQIGLVYGTIGMLSLTIGGILGGIVSARWGLKSTIWIMAIMMNVPNLVYVYLSYVLPSSFISVAVSVAIEQFGYGFGFTAFMLFMIMISEGKHKTAHYALCTGFMALGMMLPGMVSGWLQELLGYQHFFVWVMICTIPGFVLIKFLKIDPEFGTKKK